MASYTIQKIDTALLEEYVSKLQDSFSSFKTSHNDYKNSYLMQKTEASLVSMADKIDEIYKELETGYENILKWWKDYNENAVGLDQCIARKGNRIKEGVLSSFASAHFSDLSTYKLTMSNVIAYNYKNNAQYTYNVNAKTSLTGTNDVHKEENTNPSMEQIHSQMEASVTGAAKVRLANAFANSASIIKDVVMNNKIESSLSQEKFQYKPRDLTEYKSVLSKEEWQNLLEEEKQMGMQVATLKNQNEDLKGALGRLQYKYGQVCFTANNMYQGQVRPLPEEWLNYLDKEMATKIRNAQANTIDYTTVFNQILMDKTGCKNYEKYLGKVEELKTNISEMEGSIQYLEQLYKALPYVCISGTKDYHLFSKENKYNYNLDYNAYKLMEEAYSMHQESLPTFTLDKDYIQKRNLEFVSRFKKLGISKVEDFEEFSTTYFLSEENRKMYFYLKEKDPSLANKYITELSDTINQAKGTAEAILFLENLDENKVMNFLKTFNQGTGDGIQTFFDGLENVIKADGVLSVEDYKKIVILQILSEDQALKKALLKDKENLQIEGNRKMLELLTIAEERNYKKYLPGTYQFSTSFGNMIPSIAASAITSFFATPAGGAAVMGGTTGSSAIATQAVGKVVGTGLMGLSATGNATEGAMQQGYGKFESYVYGAFNGLSEATLQYFLGSIPGLSRLEGFTLGRLLSEGIEEGSQEYVDAILRKCILGQEIDIEEVIQNSGRSFLMGVTMSAFINGGQTVIRYGGKKVVLTMDKISQMYKSGDVSSISNALEANQALDENITEKIEDITEQMTEEMIDTLEDITEKITEKMVDTLEDITEQMTEKENISKEMQQMREYLGYKSFSYQKIHEFFDKFLPAGIGRYGVDQGCIRKLSSYEYQGKVYSITEAIKMINAATENGEKIPRFKQIKSDTYNELFSELRKKGFSAKDADIILNNIDVDTGVCSYAAVCNELFISFMDHTDLFEKTFGYSYYRMDNGNQVLNAERLLLDLFVFANTKSNGGNLFIDTKFFGKKINPSVFRKNINFNCTKILNADANMKYLSTGSGVKAGIIDAFLKSKNKNLKFSSEFLIDNLHESQCFSDMEMASMMYNFKQLLNNNGGQLHLDIYHDKSHINPKIIYMSPCQPGASYTNTDIWGEGGGHAVAITNILPHGFEVSSWGGKYYISFTDLFKGGKFILYYLKIGEN